MQETARNQNNPVPQHIEEDEIDLMAYISVLWKEKAVIIKYCVVGAIVALILGFSIPKTYKASVDFAPEQFSDANANMSNLASIMGINLNQSIDAINIDIFPEVVSSTPFIFELFELPVRFERKSNSVSTTLLDYMLNYQKMPWWNHILAFPGKMLAKRTKHEPLLDHRLDPTNLPKKVREVVEQLAEEIEIDVNKKSNMTNMSIELQDPEVVADVMNAIVDNLKKYVSDYRTSKARQDVENLQLICSERRGDYYAAQKAYAKFVDENKNVVRQSAQVEKERLQQEMNLAYEVYSQVAAQLESARIQEQQDKPVFTIINPVTVPLTKSAPSKTKLLIVITFLAGCLGVAWVLAGKEICNKLKTEA